MTLDELIKDAELAQKKWRYGVFFVLGVVILLPIASNAIRVFGIGTASHSSYDVGTMFGAFGMMFSFIAGTNSHRNHLHILRYLAGQQTVKNESQVRE